MFKHNRIIFFLLLLSSCQSEKDKLLKEGYQIFEKQKFAIKCPCELKKEPYPKVADKKNIIDYHYTCIMKNEKDENYTQYMVQFLPNKKMNSSELKENREKFHETMKRDVESITLTTRNGHEVFFLKYTPHLYSEIYLNPEMTYYINAHGKNAHKTDDAFFNSVVFLK